MDSNPTVHIFLIMAKLGLLEQGNLEILSEIPQGTENLDLGIKLSTDKATNVIFMTNMFYI